MTDVHADLGTRDTKTSAPGTVEMKNPSIAPERVMVEVIKTAEMVESCCCARVPKNYAVTGECSCPKSCSTCGGNKSCEVALERGNTCPC